MNPVRTINWVRELIARQRGCGPRRTTVAGNQLRQGARRSTTSGEIPSEVTVVPETTEELLTQRQLMDYRAYREEPILFTVA